MKFNQGVKIRAIHVIRHVERVDRDLDELNRIHNNIKEDRAYAARLRDSLAEEIVRLGKLKSRLLSQVVKAPEMEIDPVEGQLKALESSQDSGPELILPDARNPSSIHSVSQVSKTKEKPREAVKGRSEKTRNAEKPGAFDFRYD